ncbi:MarR family transcriptional regulator [Streptomyces sp. ODS28]|uniref:MarR family winged helix-turn-helix transcriptional regulator n=1 Tax=Streptomyces sp. ODS28 TaxID=3136688 RepID=UPI0031E7523C
MKRATEIHVQVKAAGEGPTAGGAGGEAGAAPGPAAPGRSAGLDEAAAGLGTQVVRFARLVTAWRQSARTDASAADRVLLAKLVVQGDRRATDLAADALLDLSTVSRQVRSLVERGLVERYRAQEDRRGTLLRATEAGRATYEEYRRQRDAELAEVLETWSAKDRDDLVRLMGRLNDDLEEGWHRHTGHPPAAAPAPRSGQQEQEQQNGTQGQDRDDLDRAVTMKQKDISE